MEELRGYHLVEEIGRGAYAVVWRARQPSVDRDVAIKQIHGALATQPAFIRRFEAEAQVVARLQHPHVVPLVDFWREPDAAYLVMAYVGGGTLEQRLDDGPLDLAATRRMLVEVGSALGAAHERGIVHRDVEAANILYDEHGYAYLGDFGIAVDSTTDDDTAAALSPGTPLYAAPEQLRREPVGPATDVFSLGIVAYECLAGNLPFRSTRSGPELFHRQLHEPLPDLAPSGVDVTVAAAVARATAKDPADRYATVDAFLAAIDAGGPVRLPGPTRNPFIGLRAFDEADAEWFFGRDRLVHEVVTQLSGTGPASRAAFLVGGSGSGKSSVLRAGVVPALRSGAVRGSDEWFFTTMRPGADPFGALADAIERIATTPVADLSTVLRSGRRGVVRAVRRAVGSGQRVALVIDQFEELFTDADRADADDLLDALAEAVSDPAAGVVVLGSLRADFYDRPLAHAAFATVLKSAAVDVTPLAADELEQVVSQPAARAGLVLEPGLLGRIIAETVGQAAPLPLLQYALAELADRGDGRILTNEAFDELGGIAGTLASTAERLHAAAGAEERKALRLVLLRLVAVDIDQLDVRRRLPIADFDPDQQMREAIDALADARLVTFDRDPRTREPTVEYAHEALLRRWPRLTEWLDEDRDGLRRAQRLAPLADRWEADGRADADLLRGARLDAAADLADERPALLRPVDRSFIQTSIDADATTRVRQAAEVRRLRRLVAGVGVALVVALVAGVVANGQRRRADAEAARAERAASDALDAQRDAESAQGEAEAATEEAITNALANRTLALTGVDRAAALLFALHAYERQPGPETTELLVHALRSDDGLRLALAAVPAEVDEETCNVDGILAEDGMAQYASIDGRRVVVDLTTGDVEDAGPLVERCAVWRPTDFGYVIETDLRTGAVAYHPTEGGPPIVIADDPDRFAVFGGLWTPLRLVDIRDGPGLAERWTLFDPISGETLGPGRDVVRPVGTFSPTGEHLLISSGTQQNPDGGGPLAHIDPLTGAERWATTLARRALGMTIDTERNRVIVASAGLLTIIDLDTGEQLDSIDLAGLGSVVTSFFRSVDEIVLVTDDRVEFIDPETARFDLTRGFEIETPAAATVRSDGALLVHTDDHRNLVYGLDGASAVRRRYDFGSSNAWVGYSEGLAAAIDIGTGDIETFDVDSGVSTSFTPLTADGRPLRPLAGGPGADQLIVAFAVDGRVGLYERDGTHVDDIVATDLVDAQIAGGTGEAGRIAVGYTGEDGHEVVVVAVDPVDGLTRELTIPTAAPPAGSSPVPGGGVVVVDTGGTLTHYDGDGEVVRRVDAGLPSLRFGARDDDSGLVAFADDFGAVVYDPASGDITEVSDQAVVNVEIVLDGSAVVLGTRDGTFVLKEIDGDGSIVIGEFAGALGNPTWDPDRSSVWVPAQRGIVEFVVGIDAWKRLACEVAGRELTETEWRSAVPEGVPLTTVCP